MTALDDLVGEAELAVEFEGSGLDRQRPRCCSRLSGLVDDAHFDAELREPERKHQPRRARSDD